MKHYFALTVMLLTLTSIGVSYAQCHLDGRSYDEGTVIAGYVCKDGSWHEISSFYAGNMQLQNYVE